MSKEKRDLLIHYDEENQKLIFISTDVADTVAIREKGFCGVCPDIEFYRGKEPDEAEKLLGEMVFSFIDLHSTKKIGIRDYEKLADDAHTEFMNELEEEAKRNNPEAQYLLFIECRSSAVLNYSNSDLERAEFLLKAAADGGYPDAIETLKDWAEVKATLVNRKKHGKSV